MAVGNTEFPKIVPSSGENVEFLNIFSTRETDFLKSKIFYSQFVLNFISYVIFQVSST